MTEFVWFSIEDVVAFHEQQITEHGGIPGIRDMGLLESALSRPQMKMQFGEADLASIAAAYAFGIARNHPFLDGNKRTALVTAEAFLVVHGTQIAADDAEVVAVILALASGEIEEEELLLWIREQLVPLPGSGS